MNISGVHVMRKGYFAVVAVIASAGAIGHPARLAAQETIEPMPTVEIIGPLYAYGPEPSPPRYGLENRPAYRPYYRPRPYGPRYGDRNYRPYRDGSGYDRTPRYGYRYGYAPPNRYAPPRLPQRVYPENFAARIITPRMSGRWRDLGPIYPMQAY
jgi:hypothetical protein